MPSDPPAKITTMNLSLALLALATVVSAGLLLRALLTFYPEQL